MKYRIMSVLFSLILVFGAAALAKNVVIESRWASTPVLIDGKDKEWPQEELILENGSKAQYAIRNDARNLYVYFIFKSPMSFTTIEFTGMRIFFNSEGKKSKDLGMHFYKKQVEAEEFIATLEKKGDMLTDEQKAELLKRKTVTVFESDVINNKKLEAPSDPAIRNDAPAFRAAIKDRALIYEFRVPLSRVNQPGGLGAEPGKTVKIGFEWGGMVKEAAASMGATRSEASTRARATENDTETMLRGGNEYGEGGGGGMDIYRDPRFKRHSFWIDVQLATK